MAYNIYAGLGGGFGGAYFQYVSDARDEATAEQEAYELACEIFDNQIGVGIESHEDLMEEAVVEVDREDYNTEEEYQKALDCYVESSYNDLRDSWIEYYVEETDEENYEDDDDYYDDSDEF